MAAHDEELSDTIQGSRRQGWWVWMAPRNASWAPAFLYAAVLVNFVIGQRASPPFGRIAALAGLLLLLVLIDRWAFWRYGELPPLRARVLLLLAQALLVELAVQVEGFELSAFLYLTLPFTALLWFGVAVGYGAGALIWAVFALKVLSEDGLGGALEGLFLFAMGDLFLLALSQLALQERRTRIQAEALLAELARSHRQLERYAAQVDELATVRERNRVARDIHDGLGHALTAVSIQLAKALAFRSHDARVADDAIQIAKRLADDALDEVRRSVSALRAQPTFALGQALTDLIAPLRDGPPQLTLEFEGDEAHIPASLRVVLFRVAQEALTNIQRHAKAQHASLAVACTLEEVRMRIADDGCGFDPALVAASSGGGYGLYGAAERLALVGGSLRVESAPGAGTTLTVHVPCTAGNRPWATGNEPHGLASHDGRERLSV